MCPSPTSDEWFKRTLMLPRTFVVFDLETNADRAASAEHEIIEIGAVLLRDGVVVDTWSSLARAGRPLCAVTREVTGLRDEDLVAERPLEEVLTEFFAFVGDQPLVAHNGFGFDYEVLDAAANRLGLAAPPGIRLDSLELAHVVFPRAGEMLQPSVDESLLPPGRNLVQLATALRLEQDGRAHRALFDAQLTATLLTDLLHRLSMTSPITDLQRWVLETSGHPWSRFLAPGAAVPLAEVVAPPAPPAERTPTNRYDPNSGADALSPGGSLLTAGRSPRAPQVEMARRIGSTFARGGRLLVEAPTGTGKTLAYIAPAIDYARAAGAPVAIATHTKVLQNQVMQTIAEIEAATGLPINTALVKGKENYIDLHALEAEIESLPFDTELGLLVAVIVGWVGTTPTGEWDDLRVWAIERRYPQLAGLRWRLSIGSVRTQGLA